MEAVVPDSSAYSQELFSPKNNYYAVTDGEKYSYHIIKIEDEDTTKQFFRLKKNPPFIQEGFACIGGRIYYVPIADLLRRVIRKSREIKLEDINGNLTSNSNAVTKTSSTTIQDSNESRAVILTELEINKAANVAWVNEIDALLSASDTETEEGWFNEWEISNDS